MRVFEDRKLTGDWRVEYQDHDGSCFVTLFGGSAAKERAHAYADALKSGALQVEPTRPDARARAE